jgi:hypothetical protein
VREHDEDEEEPEAYRRHDEEVGGHDLACVIRQKRAPGLGRWTPLPSYVLGHGRLTHRDPQLQELAVNPRSTPQSDSRRTCRESARARQVAALGGRCGVGFSRSRRGETRGDATR